MTLQDSWLQHVLYSIAAPEIRWGEAGVCQNSHMKLRFIDYADRNRILLAVLPPHSTHWLQPLMRPILTLGTYHSQEVAGEKPGSHRHEEARHYFAKPGDVRRTLKQHGKRLEYILIFRRSDSNSPTVLARCNNG
jgi:hypothetical protein